MNDLRIFKLDGPSMSPFLVSEDVVTVKSVSENLKIGHCYLLKQNNLFLAHRYLGKNKFKGDRLIYVDTIDEVVGEISHIKIKNQFKKLNYGLNSRLLAFLSELNVEKNKRIRFIVLSFIVVIGKIERLK